MTSTSRLNRFAFAAVLALGLCGCEMPAADAPGAETVLLDPREIVAVLPQGVPSLTLLQGARDAGFVLRDQLVLDGLDLQMMRFTFPAPLDGKGAIEVLETIEPRSTAGVNHVYRPEQAGRVAELDFAPALIGWPDGGCRALVAVGMIDTSVDRRAIAALGADVVTRDFLRGRASTTQHGTDVAAVLVEPARVQDVRLYSAAVIGLTDADDELTGVDSILQALNWLAEQDVRLVNMSFSGPYNKILDQGVQGAVASGMVLVAAVGNDGPRAEPRFPAAFDDVIAVTAVDANRIVFRDAVRGDHVDIAAPGVDVMVHSTQGPRFVTGTSIATPFVTARIMTDGAMGGLDAAAVTATLAADSRDAGAGGSDPVFGAGILSGPDQCIR